MSAAEQLKPELTLFAVVFNRRVRRGGVWGWVPAKPRYMKCPDAATARATVIRSEKCRVDIIGVAPAVGFFVEDNHGEKLSAD